MELEGRDEVDGLEEVEGLEELEDLALMSFTDLSSSTILSLPEGIALRSFVTRLEEVVFDGKSITGTAIVVVVAAAAVTLGDATATFLELLLFEMTAGGRIPPE